VHEITADITLFEGRNGSGKTSLINAIIWALTGEILRPQSEPEAAKEEFECWVSVDGSEKPSLRKLTLVTPLPDAETVARNSNVIPADTWVELTFVDESGATLPPIRRSQSRSSHGRLIETEPDLSRLGLDPIGARIGTVMPGWLPRIRVGVESELGQAVSQLTGLSALGDLAGHVRRAKQKIDKELIRNKELEKNRCDEAYNVARTDLNKELASQPAIAPAKVVPVPSDDSSIETALADITRHFEAAKAGAFEAARGILGAGFDPADASSRAKLEKNISPALHELGQLMRLPSLSRLHALRVLTADELQGTRTKIGGLIREARVLESLARAPTEAARIRLYARVANWLAEHPDPRRRDEDCVVCGGSVRDVKDPVTGKLVSAHLHEAAEDAALLSLTLERRARAAQGELARSLPEALRAELSRELPNHPCDLIRAAFVDELFALEPFLDVLQTLKAGTAAAFDSVVANRTSIAQGLDIVLPSSCRELGQALMRLDKAIRFALWRQENDGLAREIFEKIVGRKPKDGQAVQAPTLTGKLLALDATVKGAEPISRSLVYCGRLSAELTKRRTLEKRIREYVIASAALEDLLSLGGLADEQVDHLRRKLREEAAKWRDRIYVGAFPSTAHELVDTPMGRKGEIDLVVRAGGVSASAQHVANASALRASLVGFYLAFWEHVLLERGGLRTLLLDDPLELLDNENRDRLADSLGELVATGAQVLVTSYDRQFSGQVARLPGGRSVEHLAIHPATDIQPCVRTSPSEFEIKTRKKLYDEDRNAENPARSFADGCRVFLETTLGDLFEDDAAYSSWVKENPSPTLANFVNRLRPLVKSSPQGMFGGQVFTDFLGHPGLVEGSAVMRLMHKAHHGSRVDIRASEVAQCADALSQLVGLAEKMYDERSRWKRSGAAKKSQVENSAPPALAAMRLPDLRIYVCPDLAAFTQRAPVGGTQEAAEPFNIGLLEGKVAFYLRRNNFGFAAPEGALAIAEAMPGIVLDRRLVIARHGEDVYARRFLRSQRADIIGLTAEPRDPSKKTSKTVFLPESEVSLHQVAGILFEHRIAPSKGPEEAVLVDATAELARAEIAFRVRDDSAVPLALEKQIVLGGPLIELSDLGNHVDALVAISLDDDSSIFKRVGAPLPGKLSHLRQFESIGGLGSSRVLSIGREEAGFPSIRSVRLIVGILYSG